MSIVLCELPKAGLGNQLFPLMKAAAFAKLNDLPLFVTGYNQFKIGPYLRGEKIKRNYKGYFTFEKSWLFEKLDQLALSKYKKYERTPEPPLKELPADERAGRLFTFTELPHWSDFFAGLNEHRELVISLLHPMIRDSFKKQAEQQPAPCIGVHIRMGDFRKLRAGEDFRTVGAVRTPEEYFLNIITTLRAINGSQLPVSIFTDGYKKEFESLFSLDNVSMVENNPDIVDLLLLSRSRIIVTSAGSTFSYWAGFLSGAPVILHPDHIHRPIRLSTSTEPYFEGPLTKNNPLLVSAIANAMQSQ